VRIFQYSAHIRRRADSRYSSVDVGQTNSQYNTDNRNLQVTRPLQRARGSPANARRNFSIASDQDHRWRLTLGDN
jgi:hypothetical protein